MKRNCPNCGHGIEVNGSLYSIYTCNKCDYCFRGTESNPNLLSQIFRKFVIFTEHPFASNRTPCPHCNGILQGVAAGESPETYLTCMYCGNDIRNSKVLNLTKLGCKEIEETMQGRTEEENLESVNRMLDYVDMSPLTTKFFMDWKLKLEKGVQSRNKNVRVKNVTVNKKLIHSDVEDDERLRLLKLKFM